MGGVPDCGWAGVTAGAGDAGSFLQTGAYFVTMEAGDVGVCIERRRADLTPEATLPAAARL